MSKTLEEFENLPLAEREKECKRVAGDKERVPILVKADSSLKLVKFKWLVYKTMLLSEFMASIRRKSDVSQADALFLLNGGRLPSLTDRVSDLVKSDDGFVRVTITKENTFG